METKDVLLELRSRHGLSQDALAEKLHVTRQAVSRWENGETVPNIDTLKVLSKLYDVSINTLLGSPRQLICQCCGMPLEDGTMSREPNGSINETYCKWCYTDGQFAYQLACAVDEPLSRQAPRKCCLGKADIGFRGRKSRLTRFALGMILTAGTRLSSRRS